ncbi:MAG: hypothetical protein LC777_17415, partial [Actinobacteria bacterium]|nr:hypothetical protein [Actinomycetota bacterium]
VAPPAGAPKLRMLDVERMLTTPPAPVPWIVEPLLAKGCVTMLAGRSSDDANASAALERCRQCHRRRGGLRQRANRVATCSWRREVASDLLLLDAGSRWASGRGMS